MQNLSSQEASWLQAHEGTDVGGDDLTSEQWAAHHAREAERAKRWLDSKLAQIKAGRA